LLVAHGGVYVADRLGHVVRFVDLELGTVTTVAGTGSRGWSGDGGPANEATLSEPQALATDETGRLYIADGQNHVIRRVDTDGVIETIVGTGSPGEGANAGEGLEVSLAQPTGLTFGPDGRLWIADQLNSRVRVWVPGD
jgi:sugar lactone lactonase YvrE